jgi:Arc/MetJ-type ribon-helix-helix transcriptional regulator
MKTIRVRIPDQLYKQIRILVKDGWFRSQEDIIDEALRRFLAVNRPELLKRFILEDVEWGLSGGKGGRN